MKRPRRRFIGWVVVLMLLFCACATPPEPYEYVPDNEIKPGPGLFTGEEGTLTIYRKAMSVEPEKDTGSEETQPPDKSKGESMFRKKDTGESRQLLEGVVLTTLVHGEKTLMGQFKITKGSAIPAHSHPHEQTGIMISGQLRFNVAGEIWDVETGDSWCLPGNIEHSAEALEDSVVIEVFSPVREDYLP